MKPWAALMSDATSVLVAQLPVERRDHGLGEQVGGGHPRDVIQAPKVAGNGGQRGGDDGGVQRRHEHDEHEPREDEGELAAVKLVRSVIDGQPSLHPSPVFAWWLRTRADEQASWA